MKNTTFATLIRKGHIKNYSPLKLNVNKLPFITIINSKGDFACVYFSQAAGEIVMSRDNGFGENSVITAFLKDAKVVLTKNADGEERYKITGPGNYINAAEAFGISTELEDDFDFADFAKVFDNQMVSVNP